MTHRDPSAAVVVALQNGRVAEAERLARALTEQAPSHPFGWNALCVALIHLFRHQEALEAGLTAYGLAPTDPEILTNLAIAYELLGQLDQAVTSLEAALHVAPNARLWTSLGLHRKALGREAEAEQALRAAVAAAPDDPQMHVNLGAALLDWGRPDEAWAAFERAAGIDPRLLPAEVGLALIAVRQGRMDEAEAHYRTSLRLAPDRWDLRRELARALRSQGKLDEARLELSSALAAQPEEPGLRRLDGVVLAELGRLAEAEASLRHAVRLDAEDSEARLALSIVLGQRGRKAEEESELRKVLALRPRHPLAWNSLGLLLFQSDRLAESEAAYRQAITADPSYDAAWLNLGSLLKDEARLEEAAAAYDRAIVLSPQNARYQSNRLLLDNYIPGADPAAGLAAARRYGEMVRSWAGVKLSRKGARPVRDRLRVGLVSGDLRDHPVGYFLEGVLAALDPAKVSLCAFSDSPLSTPLTERIRPRFDQWTVIAGMGDEEAARRIHSDGIDILIDLTGHTAGGRLPIFAWRPAPLQVTWLGYSNTTGMSEIDYFLADRIVARRSDQANFAETLWALPSSYLCFTPPIHPLEVGTPPCLSGDGVTFGCFNNPAKLNDEVVALWARILRESEGARLVLMSPRYADTAFCARTLDRFAAARVSLDRVKLRGGSDREGYLRAYGGIDIALDPFPFPGGTTTVEGFWMGVPVVTLEGDRLLARAGAGFCRNLGLDDWVAADAESYLQLALAQAADVSGLAELRKGMRDRLLASPVCDARRFARELEEALWSMWRGGAPPPLAD